MGKSQFAHHFNDIVDEISSEEFVRNSVLNRHIIRGLRLIAGYENRTHTRSFARRLAKIYVDLALSLSGYEIVNNPMLKLSMQKIAKDCFDYSVYAPR